MRVPTPGDDSSSKRPQRRGSERACACLPYCALCERRARARALRHRRRVSGRRRHSNGAHRRATATGAWLRRALELASWLAMANINARPMVEVGLAWHAVRPATCASLLLRLLRHAHARLALGRRLQLIVALQLFLALWRRGVCGLHENISSRAGRPGWSGCWRAYVGLFCVLRSWRVVATAVSISHGIFLIIARAGEKCGMAWRATFTATPTYIMWRRRAIIIDNQSSFTTASWRHRAFSSP